MIVFKKNIRILIKTCNNNISPLLKKKKSFPKKIYEFAFGNESTLPNVFKSNISKSKLD